METVAAHSRPFALAVVESRRLRQAARSAPARPDSLSIDEGSPLLESLAMRGARRREAPLGDAKSGFSKRVALERARAYSFIVGDASDSSSSASRVDYKAATHSRSPVESCDSMASS